MTLKDIVARRGVGELEEHKVGCASGFWKLRLVWSVCPTSTKWKSGGAESVVLADLAFLHIEQLLL